MAAAAGWPGAAGLSALKVFISWATRPRPPHIAVADTEPIAETEPMAAWALSIELLSGEREREVGRVTTKVDLQNKANQSTLLKNV